MLPIGFAHASTMAFGNIAYLYHNGGAIQMLKSFAAVMVMSVDVFYGTDKIDALVLTCIIIICTGTALTCTSSSTSSSSSSSSSMSYSLGVILVFLAELFEAIRLVCTQFFLQNLRFGVVESLYILAPASGGWLLLAASIFELPSMLANDAFAVLWAHPMIFVVAAGLGLGINSLSFLVIQHTSSVTMKVSQSGCDVM